MRCCWWVSLYVGLASILSGQIHRSINQHAYGIRTVPAEGVPAGLAVTAIAASGSRSLALTSDGTAWGWGGNAVLPMRVGRVADATAVALGDSHTVALKGDGTVWAWGANSEGQLGDGTTATRATPVQVSGLTGVTAVAAGGPHTLALKGDGTVWAWGGTYGYGYSSLPQSAPAQVRGLTWVSGVAAGPGYSLAVKFDGTVWQWGPYGSGTPAQVTGLTGVVAIATTGGYGLALKSNGTVCEWRIDAQYSFPPAVQVSELSDVTSLAAARWGGHRLALKRDGTVWAWGSNYHGQLGNEAISSDPYESSRPAQVSGLTGAGREDS